MNDLPPGEQSFKIVVLGEGGVGKSAVTVQLTQNHFIVDYDPTIENSYRKQLLVDEEMVTLDILDTAGQEEYAVMRHQYIRQGQGFALVYSVGARDTYESMAEFHAQILDVKGEDKAVPIVLLGNKCDLPAEDRQVTTEEGEALAKKFGVTFFETSAKERINIEEAFIALLRIIRDSNKAGQDEGGGGGKPKKEKKEKSGKKCCCCVVM